MADNLIDFKNFYIIKKFYHGWLVGLINTQETLFVDRDQLIKMGYIRGLKSKESLRNKITTSASPIIIPIALKQQKRFHRGRNKN